MTRNRRGIIVHPEELRLDWLDRMAEARLNTLGLHPVGGRDAHLTLQKAIDMHTLPESIKLRAAAASRGISVEYEAHVMAWLLPRHLFDRHPDWFRMDDKGQRAADFNLCASNQNALDYVAQRTATLATLLDTGANKHYYWLDDVTGHHCSCPDCRSLSPSDQQLIVVNAMLSGLKRVHKNAKLCYLAYHDALQVPARVEPLDGVFLEYAPIRRDHRAPINDPNNEKNAQEVAPLKDLISFFGTKDSRVLDYWMDNSLFSNWTKPPKAFQLAEEVMKRDVDFYRSLGMEDITSFGCYLGPDYEELHGKASLAAYGRILMG
ncbi:MAG: DUF4838 domain-containing protein [Christensenellales bacterium]